MQWVLIFEGPTFLRLLWMVERYDMEGLATEISQSIALPVNNLEN